MIRTHISEEKVERLIKRTATTPEIKEEEPEDIQAIKNVQLRIPLVLLKEIDKLRVAKKKKRVGVGESRHDFFLEAILKAVNDGYKDLKKVQK